MCYEDITKHLHLDLKTQKHKNIYKLAPFVTLDFSHLIRLAKEFKVIIINEESRNLRNSIMHAHDLVRLDDAYRGDYIYTLESFVAFYNQVNVFLQDYKKVNNRSALLDMQLP